MIRKLLKLVILLMVVVMAFSFFSDDVSDAPSVGKPTDAKRTESKTNTEPDVATTPIHYKVLKREELGNIKVSFDLEVDLVQERLPTKDELAAVSIHLKAREKPHERTFVMFYLPGMEVGAGAFATGSHNPELEVIINKWALPEKYQGLAE